MVDVMEVDAESGSTVERDYTPDELAQRVADEAAAQGAAAAQAALEAEQAAARAAAIDHAKSLGFTDAMISVMYPNLIGA